MWHFSKTEMITDKLFDTTLKRFYEYGIDGLVRENIQNSLDAKLLTSNEPVVVKINLGKIKSSQIPGHNDIIKRVYAFKPTNEYTRETVNFMKQYVREESFNYISFEDENTKGLSGAYQNNVMQTSYGAYAYNKGNHFNDSDVGIENEKVRGGSHGVGKIASNAASIFHTMFFSNHDAQGNQTLGGTAQLMEHHLQGVNYRSTGYYAKGEPSNFKPYETSRFPSIFHKNTRGLKIVIPYLRKSFNNKKEIIKTVVDSFMLSILSNKLSVEVNGETINSETIESYIKSDEYFEQTVEKIKERFTPLYYNTYTNLYNNDFIIKDKAGVDYHFKLYFTYDENIRAGRTGIFRTLGMKIEDKKITNNVTKPYNALLIPKTSNEDKFLKSLENESHTKLDFKHINSEEKQDNAKRFINNIDRAIEQVIEEKIDELTPDSGALDTKDILYVMQDKFKKDIQKRMSTVKVGDGKKNKHVIKTKDTDEKGHSQRNHKKNGQIKRPRKVKKTFGDLGQKEYYDLHGGFIKRSQSEGQEKIEIDVKKYGLVESINSGNILVSIIDGMGYEHQNEIDLRDEFTEIMDRNTYQKLDFDNISIKNVDLNSGKIRLDLRRKPSSRNKYAKLKYYLEV